MADGVAITAGSGTTILTDDTGAGGHAQVVKLAISTDGSGTLIPATADGFLVAAAPAALELAATPTAHVKKYYTSTGAATDGIVWSPAAGKRWYVTDLIINVS